MPNDWPTNREIADLLNRIAELLEAQDANPHRVRAYRRGAQTVKEAESAVADMVEEGGREALQDLPNVGEGLSRLIVQYVHSGRSELLERLQGEMDPTQLFVQVSGVGETLARRIVETLDVNTLEDLEQAAHESRLRSVEGFGPKRVRTVRVSLAGMLSRSAQRRMRGEEPEHEPPRVELLLDVDREYRRKAEKEELKKIAPKRFNPEGKAWLPILHTERSGWNLTALYSNTARAHRLDKTHDWVVIYYDRDGQESQATVVTETSGPLEGKRVVRGREAACRRYYRQSENKNEI